MGAKESMLELARNLAATHREHEKHYGAAPLRDAQRLMEHSRTLKALAERWSSVTVSEAPLASPFAGADDLNDLRAVETTGVLFLESGEAPAEIGVLRRDLERLAADAQDTGAYLCRAMEASWGMAAGLLACPDLDDLLVERHGIIARDGVAGALLGWEARQLRRAAEVLEHVDFAAAALRDDLAGPRRAPSLLFAAADLIDAAAESCLESARLVRGNERSWRLFRDRVEGLLDNDDTAKEARTWPPQVTT